MEIEFITTPDVIGQGRVVVDGLFYGLPVEAVKELEHSYSKKCVYEARLSPTQLSQFNESSSGHYHAYCKKHGWDCPNTD